MTKDYRVQMLAGDVAKEYVFVGGPLDDFPDGVGTMFEAIGYVVASWSRVEQHLDTIIMQINEPGHAANLYDDNHPISFRPKLAFIKKWFNQSPALASYADEMRQIRIDLKRLGGFRDDLVHSTIQSFDAETKTAKFESIRFLKATKEFKVEDFTADITFMAKLAAAINRTNFRLGAISKELFTPDAAQRSGKP